MSHVPTEVPTETFLEEAFCSAFLLNKKASLDMFKWSQMHDSRAELSLVRPFPAAVREKGPSPLEEEITALFDEFREALLRYLVSFGVTAQDAEEVIQEVFLSL